ncbi:MAG: LysR family transcriptional regulator [Oscillospiraceae bacterium]
MNLLHFKYALEVAKTRSISKAAENLFMGQPNLSRAIKELESDLGITIFNRTSKGISLTPDGEQFIRHAQRIINQVEEIENIYKKGKRPKQRLSVCVPRASYISKAMTEFAEHIRTDMSAEISYRETNSSRTISCVVNGECDMGIIRYQMKYDKYFESLFVEKHLTAETITNFSYLLLMSKKHDLAEKEDIKLSDLTNYIEISHADPYVPSLPLIDVRKEELSPEVDKRIFIFERGSQFELLENVPTTFMWVSPIPDDMLARFELVQKKCTENTKIYRDVLIYRDDYQLTALDNKFIESVVNVRQRYM